MRNKLTLILILTIILSSCEFKINTNNSKKADLGTMPKIKPQTFDNIYIADEKVCDSKELPITRFAIEYPNGFDIETPTDKQNHIIIKKKIDRFMPSISYIIKEFFLLYLLCINT